MSGIRVAQYGVLLCISNERERPGRRQELSASRSAVCPTAHMDFTRLYPAASGGPVAYQTIPHLLFLRGAWRARVRTSEEGIASGEVALGLPQHNIEAEAQLRPERVYTSVILYPCGRHGAEANREVVCWGPFIKTNPTSKTRRKKWKAFTGKNHTSRHARSGY